MKFNLAIKRINLIHNNYADGKNGETYCGIPRVDNKDWEGWEIIDSYKKKENFPTNLDEDSKLRKLVLEYYKKTQWDIMKLDEFPYMISEELLDMSTNIGKQQTVKYLQRAVNILNMNETLWKNVKVTGRIDKHTISVVKICLKKRGTQKLFNMLNHIQAKHYIELIEKNGVDEEKRKWFDRVNFINKERR